MKTVAHASILASTVALANGHGFLIDPPARQPGVNGFDTAGTNCPDNSCGWYSNQVKCQGSPTICDRDLLTSSLAIETSAEPCGQYDWETDRPWRAPGTASVLSPCGMKAANSGSTNGVNLPAAARAHWVRGSTAEVAMSVTANHGGGYTYRLCPAGSAQTEACFQANPLRFARNTTTVVKTNGDTLTIGATRTTAGTHPAGSEWTKNPIPQDESYFPAPFAGASGSHWAFSLVDELAVPADLSAGNYTLSWRWDTELTSQVWTNCGDVTVDDDTSADDGAAAGNVCLPDSGCTCDACCASYLGDQDACDGCVADECDAGAVAANASARTAARVAAADDPVNSCHEAAKAFCDDGHDSCKVCQAWGTWGDMFFATVCNDDTTTCHEPLVAADGTVCGCQQEGGCAVSGVTCPYLDPSATDDGAAADDGGAADDGAADDSAADDDAAAGNVCLPDAGCNVCDACCASYLSDQDACDGCVTDECVTANVCADDDTCTACDACCASYLSDDQDACDGCVTNECTGGAAVAANASPMTSTRKAAADDPVDACHEAAKAYCNDGRDSCHVCQAWGTWGDMFFATVCNDDTTTCHEPIVAADGTVCGCQQEGGCAVSGVTCPYLDPSATDDGAAADDGGAADDGAADDSAADDDAAAGNVCLPDAGCNVCDACCASYLSDQDACDGCVADECVTANVCADDDTCTSCDACCASYLSDQDACDGCVTSECA